MAGMVPKDVYELTGAADPRLSPDGATVAYSVWSIDEDSNSYRSAIWLAAVDGSTAPRRFTAGEKRDSGPRWSPDGSMLAFTSNREKDAPQLYVMPVTGGEPKRLTDLKQGVGEVEWSPDGTRIAFSSRVAHEAYDEEDDKKRPPRRFRRLWFKLDNEGWTGDRRQHVFTVAADGTDEPKQITDGDTEDEGPRWSPDGSRIAFASARHDDWDVVPARDIFVVDADGGEPTTLTKTDGVCAMPSWSPDGSEIAYYYVPGIFDDPRHAQIAVTPVDGGDRRVLTESLDRNCAPYPPAREPVWDGEEIVFVAEDGGNDPIYRVPADGSAEPRLAEGGERIVTGFDVAGGVLVVGASTPTTLAEVYVGERKLTSVGDPFVTERDVPAPERYTATSKDGTEVECWIMRPAGFVEDGTKHPVLLNVHGGPFTQYGNKFFDEFQVYAGAGYAVVYCNPRGSSGYSEAWGRAIRGPVADGPGWGTVDYEDVMACVEEAVKRFDFCDPDRVGIMGGSYGGFMTSWAVGHTDRFKAAISERAVNQWVSMWGSSDFGWAFKGEIGAFIHENFDAWVKMSPQTYATNIATPLLILHSENDLRCPIEQGEQLFTTLRLLKRDVEMVRFPAEGHELTRSGNPAHRVQRLEIILEWLSEHL